MSGEVPTDPAAPDTFPVAAEIAVPRWRRQLATTVFRTNLYRAALRRGSGLTIAWTPPLVVPGSTTNANAMFQGRYTFAGHTVQSAKEAPWRLGDIAPSWLSRCHEFGWLADFAAADGPTARRHTRALIRRWIADFGRWSPLAWRPDILGMRLVSWLAHADFLLVDAEPDFGETFLGLIGEQVRHLNNAQGMADTAAQRTIARASYLTASFALGRRLAQHERHLQRLITCAIPVADGTATRMPSDLLRTLPSLLTLRDALRAGETPPPTELDGIIDRMGSALRLLTHGDEGLAVFHGGVEEDAETVATVVARTAQIALPATFGFARLEQGRLRVIAETAGAPPQDDGGFASALAIEVSIGKERLFVNCGSPDGDDSDWLDAARATAAHTALVIDDHSQDRTDVAASLPNVLRGEEGDNVWLEITSNGYARTFGVHATRRYHMAKDGHELVCEERVDAHGAGQPTSRNPQELCARYHLHPKVTASMLGDGQQVLLRLGNGTGWVFEVADGTARLEDSVYFGEAGKPRRSKQIVVTRQFSDRVAGFMWHLIRMDGRA
ncbi:MAG: heparinase II/III family protein [Alphaproteobacteria bacterium]|nr:heparinase II/III family protein [Alphaproteobacteria bacterium]